MEQKKFGKGGAGKPHVVLVLQGGGALGAYHIGAYQALAEAGLHPDWVTGISIGAINSAVVVGNQPSDRLAALEGLWDAISRNDSWGALLPEPMERLFNQGSAMEALAIGQPNFFTPRVPNPYFAPPGSAGATSFYDTSPLRGTLERFASFDLINKGPTRISLGATKVTTGDLVFFDNRRQAIAPEHVMASGSLPPGFPATYVEGEPYWDGGCVSNTPLEAVLDDPPAQDTIVFMIDLWDAHGPVPTTMDEVLWRQKRIQYASRTAHHIRQAAHRVTLGHALHKAAEAGGVASKAVSDAEALTYRHKMDIVHIIYHPTDDQVSQSDAEFSRPSIAKRRQAGYADMVAALESSPWSGAGRPDHVGAVVHRVKGARVERSAVPA